MNVDFHLSAEIESRLRKSAADARVDVGTFVERLVTERLKELATAADPMSAEEFAARQAAWVKLFPVLDHAIDDSRDALYAGRE